MNRLRNTWNLLNLPCEEMSRLASRSLDGGLAPMERFVLRLHLLYCAACRRYRRQLGQIQGALRKLAGGNEAASYPEGPGLPDQVREGIKRAIKSL
jgi:predicted anti-sigma-YlaC factor YlaD